jgi:glycosyltransferase involved in cell wall biosynthesis
MLMKKILTIGIPSYDRISELTKLVTQIYDNNLFKYLNLLIVDDGKQKKIRRHFRSDYPHIYQHIKILENEGNLGYASTFLRILDECETDYLLMMADDDFIDPDNIEPLINYINNNAPDFISPQFFRNLVLERGVKKTRDIEIDEYRLCCNHAPGLVYKISSCKPFLDILKVRVEKGKSDVMMYPQVALVIHLFHAQKKCVWLDFPTAYEGGNLPSEIRDADGSNYWEFIPRCKQLIDFDELLFSLNENDASKRMLEIHRMSAFNEIASSLMISRPKLGTAFYLSSYDAIFKYTIKKNKFLRMFKRLYLDFKAILHIK